MKCEFCLSKLEKKALKCKQCGEWANDEYKNIYNTIKSIKSKINSNQTLENESNLKISKILNIIDLVKLNEGDEVYHEKLGKGKVSKIEIPQTIIDSIGNLRCEFIFEQRNEPYTFLLTNTRLKRVFKENDNSLLDELV